MSLSLTLFEQYYGINPIETDLNVANPIALNLSIKDFTIIAGEANNIDYFSFDIEFVETPQNNKAHFYQNHLNNYQARFKRGQQVKAFLIKKGLVFKGKVLILNTKVENKCLVYVGQFLGGLKNWLSAAPQLLCELDLGTSTFDRPTIEGTWNDNPYDGSFPLHYSLKYYGNYSGYNSTDGVVDFVDVDDMRPDVFEKAILEAIEKASKVKIQSQFFNMEYFRRWMLPFVNDENEVGAEGITLPNYFFESENSNCDPYAISAAQSNGGLWAFTSDAVCFTHNDPFAMISGDYFALPLKGRYCLNFKGDVLLGGLSPQFKIQIIDATGTIIAETGLLLFGSGLNITLFFDALKGVPYAVRFMEATNPNIDVNISLGAILNISLKKVDNGFYEGSTIDHAKLLPCKKISEYIGSLSDRFNIIFFYDEKYDRVIAEPKYPVTLPTGEQVSGFYKSIAHAENWTDKITCSNEQTNFSVQTDMKRQLVFKFQEDGNDKYIPATETNPKLYLAHIEPMSEKFMEGQKEQACRLFAPTKNGYLPDPDISPQNQNPNIAPFIPFFINFDPKDKNANIGQKYNYEPSFIYKLGIRQGTWNWYNSNNVLNTYPFAAQVSEIPNYEVNGGYVDVGNQKGFVSLFFRKDIELFNFGVVRTLKALLNDLEINNLDFRKLKYISTPHGGATYFILEAIEEYIINEAETTNIKLISFL